MVTRAPVPMITPLPASVIETMFDLSQRGESAHPRPERLHRAGRDGEVR
ncbi:MAG: hypothetical protein ACREPF_04965 [Rhodanobacteraceae bacterium]